MLPRASSAPPGFGDNRDSQAVSANSLVSPRSQDPGRRSTGKGSQDLQVGDQKNQRHQLHIPGQSTLGSQVTSGAGALPQPSHPGTGNKESGSNSEAVAPHNPFSSMVRKQATRITKAPAEGVGTPQGCRSSSSTSKKAQVCFCIPGTPAEGCGGHPPVAGAAARTGTHP